MKNIYLEIPARYSRTIVVGDIHGCFDEFAELIRLVGFNDNDVLVSVGDMLDRGPKSWQVCQFFRDRPNAFSVLGNHERRVLGTMKGTSQPAWSQKHSLSMLTKEERPAWVEYLERLPAVIETEHAIITHARLDPAKSFQQQDAYFTCAVGGSGIHIDLDDNGVPLWFYKTNFGKPLCMGHIGYERIELVSGKLYALDTGAVKGGELTCVIFPGNESLSVKSERDYYTESFKDWQMKEEEAQTDPRQWPLRKVIDILKHDGTADNLAIADQVAKTKLAVCELRIDEWSQSVCEQLLARFGDIPKAGPERGEYFKILSNSFSDRQLGLLAGKVIAGKVRGIEAFVPFVKKGTLPKVRQTMDMLLRIINDGK
jgi:hypothetical protein